MSSGILGQAAPGATDTTLFAAKGPTVVSTISVCETNNVASTFRVHIVRKKHSAAKFNAIAYDATLGARSSVYLTLGIPIDDGDSIVVQGSTTDVSFSAFGSTVLE